ncbi:unnamed protein product, partial [Mesorhabditis belari]|uniref:Protein kinase domain-containing protein n=1 Tax=Mesorhabditis belari TaxID=2138241 RepID=A0AAF3FFZ7_9BILA
MEFCDGGTLSELITDSTVVYSMKTVVFWAIQLFKAIRYLFYHRILHGDIKPNNIFVKKIQRRSESIPYTMKLGDFGQSRRREGAPSTISNLTAYGPPLLNDEDDQGSHKHDVYGIGLIVWELIERRINKIIQLINRCASFTLSRRPTAVDCVTILLTNFFEMDHSRCEQRYIGSGSFGEVYELIGHKPPAVIKGPLKKTIFNPNVIYSMKTVVYWTKQLFDALTYIQDSGPCGVNSQYSSPPVALGDRTIGEQVKVNSTPSHLNDVYSLGLVLWEIIERRIVFEEYVRNGSFRRDRFVADVTRNKLTKLEPPSCQKDLQEIVKRCTNFDRNERPTSRTILDELMHNEKLDRLVDFSPKVDESNQKILKPIDHGATFDREFQKEYGQEVSQTSKYLADDEMVKKAAKDENLLDRGAPATVSQIPNTDPFVIRFVKARILFVQPISKDGKPDFEEVMADIELPEEYKPDTKDRFYRPPKLSEDKHVYHVIASGNFADVIAAVNRDGKPVAAKRYKIEQLKQTIDGDTRLRREILISRSNRHENIRAFRHTKYKI